MATAMVTPTHHPKTGERRHVRRSLRLDHLPLALLDRVRAERAHGHTWSEIENDSPNWQEWEDASLEAMASFPGRRLPHSNLQRWHDLRVEQVQREQEGQARTAQALADRLAEHGVTHLNAAVKNALSDSVFHMMMENADPRLIRAELFRLAQLLSTLQRDEIAQGRLEQDRQKLKLAARKEETARCLTLSRLHGAERAAFDVDWRDSPVSREERAAAAAGTASTPRPIPPYPATSRERRSGRQGRFMSGC